jgi:hypothetical protein
MARLIPQLDFSPTLKSKQVLMIFVALLSLAGASLSCELPHILDNHRGSMPLLCPRSCEPWAQSTLHVSVTFKTVFFFWVTSRDAWTVGTAAQEDFIDSFHTLTKQGLLFPEPHTCFCHGQLYSKVISPHYLPPWPLALLMMLGSSLVASHELRDGAVFSLQHFGDSAHSFAISCPPAGHNLETSASSPRISPPDPHSLPVVQPENAKSVSTLQRREELDAAKLPQLSHHVGKRDESHERRGLTSAASPCTTESMSFPKYPTPLLTAVCNGRDLTAFPLFPINIGAMYVR